MSKRSFVFRVVCMVLAILMLLSFLAVLVFASEVESGSSSASSSSQDKEQLRQDYKDAQTRVEALEQRIDDLDASIQAHKNAAQAARQRQAAYEELARELEEQINIQISLIQEQERLIEQKKAEIAAKQKEYDDNDALFRQRLVAMYRANNAGAMSTLLNVNTFSELLTANRYLQVLSKHDTDMLERLEAQRIALEEARAEMEIMLAELEAERDSLNAKLEEYENAIAQAAIEASNHMNQIAVDEKAKEDAYNELQQAQREMEEIWKSLGGTGSGVYVGGALYWPVDNFNGDQFISSHFGPRTLYGRPDYHTGMDIASGEGRSINGVPIKAANSGTVVKVDTSNPRYGYGYYAIVDHGGGIMTLYAHCSSISVSVGQSVTRGVTEIGRVGNTGNSTGPHLHFELRKDGVAINPYPYVTGQKEF